ncbi:MAG: hypothetical protein DME76_10520 [Verrucomicrobia bacterium]|nr:MAG: hypothetical protein DME76_10520 [Verrucomicrobiota bacterium]
MGSARVSRAGDRVLAITDFLYARHFLEDRARWRKIISASRRNQHARRVRYPFEPVGTAIIIQLFVIKIRVHFLN